MFECSKKKSHILHNCLHLTPQSGSNALCSSCLCEAPPSEKAQFALISRLDQCVMIGQWLQECFGNVTPFTITFKHSTNSN